MSEDQRCQAWAQQLVPGQVAYAMCAEGGCPMSDNCTFDNGTHPAICACGAETDCGDRLCLRDPTTGRAHCVAYCM